MRLPSTSSFLPFPLQRLAGPGLSGSGIIALLYLIFSGQIDLSQVSSYLSLSSSTQTEQAVTTTGTKPEESLLIATFNIQKFGKSKLSNPQVMEQIVRICKLFDVVAIQEVLTPEANPIGNLLQQINAGGGRYDAILSTPIGRTNYREQFAFVYDTTRVRIEPNRAYVVDDPEDRMHREPFVASFAAVNPAAPARSPFTFTMIAVHTDPDEVDGRASGDNELNVLADVFVNVAAWEYARYGEDDLVILGDFNAPREKLFGLSRIPGLVTLAPRQATNTVGTKELDHIMIDSLKTAEWTNQANVIDYVRDLQLTSELAAAISDHRVVWAQFSAYEVPPGGNILASSPSTTSRQ